MAHFELREIPVTEWELIKRIGELRVRACRTVLPQANEMSVWLDQYDRLARHWAFFRDGQPVAAARLTVHNNLADVPDPESYFRVFHDTPIGPIASFNRLIVDASARGNGLSEGLDLIRLDAAESMGCRCAIGATPSGKKRLQSMAKSGFEVVGQGQSFRDPPLCYGPAPVVVICHLPRRHQ